MGASLTLPIARFAGDDEALRTLRAGRYSILAAANRPEALALEEVRTPARLAVAIGNEGSGLEPSWIAGCDALVRIPVSPAVDSLNAAVAAGIVLYALTRSARA